MADTQVLGTCVFGREGSSPFSRTQLPTTFSATVVFHFAIT